uniref:hypothetical protein n=1 Tax=Flavobacterium sp. TaxID=239 RepID=UPI00404AAC5B
MIKKVIVIVALFFGLIVHSQENTASPYSFYGLGEVRFNGTEDAKAMGGLSFAGDSISLNLLNPASYANLKLVSFGIGSTATFSKLSNASDTENARRTALDYLAIGVPLSDKFGASFGILPYSSVGYKIQSTETIGTQERTDRFTGQGNINRAFIGAGYAINENWSVGLDLQYNFGIIENEAFQSFSNVQLATRERNSSNIRGLSFNIGAFYNKKINDKLTLSSSFSFTPEAKLNSINTRNIATVSYSFNGAEGVNDSEDILINDSKLIIPTKLGLGVGIGEKNKWLLGTEITFRGSNGQNNSFDDVTNNSFENSQRYVLGGYYIPKFDSYSSYLSRVVYRAGFRYENTGLVLENQSIKDYGMNFGLGLPLGQSKINIGVEFGKRGTTSNNLIEENYVNLSLGLSLSEKWFRKRQID